MRISDWSSDVCSSDLSSAGTGDRPTTICRNVRADHARQRRRAAIGGDITHAPARDIGGAARGELVVGALPDIADPRAARSEERRVGKECVRTGRYWWWPYHYNKKTRRRKTKNN